jgi:hypothetical protein
VRLLVGLGRGFTIVRWQLAWQDVAMSEFPAEITWQEAVARLTRERAPAENAVSVLKAFGDPAAIAHGSITYTEAKAEYDGVIAGLTIALAGRQTPASLDDLEAQLARGVEKRQAFCQSVTGLIPDRTGQKGVVVDLAQGAVKGAVGPLIDALKEIYGRHKDEDALARKTIQTQLENAAWSPFAATAPLA